MLYKFNKEKGWCLIDIKKIGTPIFGITSVDITGDGVKELVVLTIKGVHILQVRCVCVNQYYFFINTGFM